MPSPQNFNAFLGAAVLGVISAAGLYLVEKYMHERKRYAMARDLARLDQELSTVKRELGELNILLKKKNEKYVDYLWPRKLSLTQQTTTLFFRSQRSKRSKQSNKASSIFSSSTTDDYSSAVDMDSSDLEFYDVSDEEVDANKNDLHVILSKIDAKLDDSEADLDKCLEELQDLCIGHPENFELLYRIGKAHHKIGDKSEDADFIKAQIEKGLAACSKAIELNANSAEAHKWYAILIGSRSEYQSMQDKITDGHLFKKHVDIAIRINPTDASLHHMLGRFDFEVAGLKWYERKVAAALFSEPPTATYEEALGHFLEAERLANFEWKENKLMIAKCKIATSNYKEAVEWLEKADTLTGSDDEKVNAEVSALLQKYNSYR